MSKVLILTNKYTENIIKYYYEKILDNEVTVLTDVCDEGFTYKDYSKECIINNIMYASENNYDIALNFNEECISYDSKVRLYNLNNRFLHDYKIIKKINSNIKFIKYVRYFINIKIRILITLKLYSMISKKIGYEIRKGSLDKIRKSIDKNIYKTKNIFKFMRDYFNYKKRIDSIYLDRPKNCKNILVLSNNYIPNEYYHNFDIEKSLSNKNMISNRYYKELYFNFISNKYHKFKIRKYCKYNLGSNVIDNIYYINNLKYDGVIFLQSKMNVKDESTRLILLNICMKKNIPFITIIFSGDTSKFKIENTVNALSDMIKINIK